MSQAPKEYHLVDLLTGESLGGFVTLSAAREEARAAGRASWDIFQANERIERHDPGVDDPVGIPEKADAIADEAGDNLEIIGPCAGGIVSPLDDAAPFQEPRTFRQRYAQCPCDYAPRSHRAKNGSALCSQGRAMPP